MFEFFRKHQRTLFLVITIATVASFIFFGTFSTFLEQTPQVADKQIVKGLSGKPLMKSELFALSQLLSTSSYDLSTTQSENAINLFNDGVLEKECLSKELSLVLAKHYFDSLKEDLAIRLKKIKQYQPYVHPYAPNLSAAHVWQRFAPQLLQHWDLLKKQGENSTVEAFALMAQLYLDQTLFPPEMLKQILFFQEQQYGVPPDPRLAQGNLSLFGWTNLEEWFGPHFIALHAQFIANAAAVAEERGYKVSREEIRSDLYQNIYSGYKRITQEAPSLTPEQAETFFHRKMQQLGLDQKMLLEAWRKVMLFRQLFADVGGSILIDSMPYQHFQEYSAQYAKVALFELPLAFQFRNLESLFKLQIYLQALSPAASHMRKDLLLPREISSLEQVEKYASALVQREVKIVYAQVKKTSLATEIPLQRTWEWEVEDSHWALLQKQFPQLSGAVHGRDERFKTLESLEPKVRLAVDAFARMQMIDAARVMQALESASFTPQTVRLRREGELLPFTGIKEREKILFLLENVAISEEEAALSPENPLYCFSVDGETFYRIKVLQRDENKRILTFAEALNNGTLDLLLDKQLEEAYPEVRKKNPSPFQLEKGGWKPLKEVKDLVGRHLFAELLKAIEESYKISVGPLPGSPGKLPAVFYAHYRLYPHMQYVQKYIKEHPEDRALLKGNSSDPLIDQWLLEKSERTIRRCDVLPFPKEEMFTLKPQQWSPVKVGSAGALAFYQILEQKIQLESSPVQINKGQELLAHEAQKQLLCELIRAIDQKKAIDLSFSLSKEEGEHATR